MALRGVFFRKIRNEIESHGGFKQAVKKGIMVFQKHGIEGVLYLVRKKMNWLLQVQKSVSAAELADYLKAYEQQLNLSQERPEEYVQKRKNKVQLVGNELKLIAFYLPQYHPFPENDEWWGKGFTEWTNVTKAQPHFLGQYQPQLPEELGFYDLRVPEVQKQQIDLARQYGLHGFCYYYYWFSGKKLMDLPLNTVLKNKEYDFPFCICWANENWTRRWDGRDQEILIAQQYRQEDDLAFIKDISPIISDERYIRVQNKPLIIVYTVYELPDAKKTAQLWRDYCREAGIGEIYLAAVQRLQGFDPREYGFDAAVEFPPHGLDWVSVKHEQVYLNKMFEGGVWDYREFVKQTKDKVGKVEEEFPVFHATMPSWDNTARRPDGKGNVFTYSSPQEYGKWLEHICEHTENVHSSDEKLVFINAWNEWAEGAHLEPDRKYGYAFLEQTACVLEKMNAFTYRRKEADFFRKKATRKNRIAIIIHLFYFEVWQEIEKYLQEIEEPFDLYITVPDEFHCGIVNEIRRTYPEVVMRTVINRGRDIAPFLTILAEIEPLGYDAVCKIHSKKSTHLEGGKGWRPGSGAEWRTEILEELIGTRRNVRGILGEFRSNPRLGVVGPQRNLMNFIDAIGSNERNIIVLQEKMQLKITRDFSFFAGSMFWFRPQALKLLLSLNLTIQDFPEEAGQIDGTLAHALERMVNICAQSSGYEIESTPLMAKKTVTASVE